MAATVPPGTVPLPLGIEVGFSSPGTARLAVTGEVDLATAPILGLRLLAVLADHRPAVMDLDLSEVAFLDCSGIGVLVAVRNAAEQVGCRVWISRPRPMPAVVLDVVGLLGLFTAPVEPVPVAPGAATLSAPRTRLARMARAMAGRKIAA